ncbi:transglutaminase domain-containing protein [Mucilaginibacter calamicampi]|uniref:Transglutaminase domain-containing protein n=1 Tax=Mucilaginibacter calamicampi TaxID=1302352 RepID=A0ABW2YX86_9SPHI
MRAPFFAIIALFLFTCRAGAQDFAFGNITQEETSMVNYVKDPAAHAVVLNEYGDARITMTNADEVRLIYKYHVKIKIFDSEAFKKGTVEVPLYIGKERQEKIDDIEGITVSTDANGGVKREELLKSQIFTVAVNQTHELIKFAMPGLRNGSVIEYRYTITTPYFEDFHDWQFQSDIPKIHSEYEAHIPGFWQYNAVKRGALNLDKNISEIERDCFSSHGAQSDCAHFIYGMNNIPAFVEEDYMTAPRNFISALYFELFEYTNPFIGGTTKLAKEWKDVDYQLKRDSYFGSQIKKSDQFKDKIAPVIAGKTDELQKAKAVYALIQKNIKWNEFISFGSENVRKAFENHTGTSGDVNLALVAALASAGINVEAVLISTRSHGVVNKLFPVITEFNYVLAKANIGGKSYLLDATDPLLSFGMLPMRCLNDQGRVMSLDKPSYWIDINTPNIQNTTRIFDLTLSGDGKLVGKITNYSRGYSGYQKRLAIKKFNTVDEFVENMDEKLSKTKVKKFEITGLDSLDGAVAEVYEVEMDGYEGLNHEKLSFNPFVFSQITTNPFKLNERSYPVDWGMASEERVILNMKLPEGYVIENKPQNTSAALPNQGGVFIVDYHELGNSFSLSHVIQFRKSIYAPEEYPYLKELYNKIILSEKSEMVFKKKI